jgi:Domain of unknown function (DUF222)
MSSCVLDHLAEAAAALQRAMADMGSVASGSAGVVVAARAIVDQAELLCTRSITTLDRAFVREDGYPTISDWLAAKTHAGPNEGSIRVKHADLLSKLPLFREAAESGTIGIAHIHVLSRAITKKRLPFLLRDEHVLLEIAKSFTVANFSEAVTQWVAHCDDAVTAPESEDEQQDERRVQLTETLNGMWHLEGMLDPIAGSNLNAAINAAMPKPSEDDNRTVCQKRHDALNDLALEILGNEDRSEINGQQPHVTVHIDAGSGLAHINQRIYLSSVTRDMLLCNSITTSVWLKANGVPFDVGTPTSEIPKRNRRAVKARDGGCRFPGCGHPSRWTDLHHLKFREDGGTHEIENLVEFCRFHHRYTHRKNLKVYWNTDGITLMVEWPNGIVKHAPPIRFDFAA